MGPWFPCSKESGEKSKRLRLESSRRGIKGKGHSALISAIFPVWPTPKPLGILLPTRSDAVESIDVCTWQQSKMEPTGSRDLSKDIVKMPYAFWIFLMLLST